MASSRKPPLEADESTAQEGSPPTPDVVAARALMVAALLERAKLESSRDGGRQTALARWVEAEGLFGNLGPEGAQLFDAALGAWSDEDVDAVAWTGEELLVLLWALGRAELPSPERQADVAALLKAVPLLAETDAFVEQATSRAVDELEARRALYEVLHEAVRAEVYARSIQEDPLSLELDDELEELLATVAAEGFDRKKAAAEGKAAEAIAGLRFWSRSLLTELSAGGAHGGALDSARLVSLDDAALATLLGVTHARAEALGWLVEGDEYGTVSPAEP